MTFGEALDQMHKGRVVARRAWPCFASNARGLSIHVGVRSSVLWVDKGRWWIEYAYMHEDVLARDWEVLDVECPK